MTAPERQALRQHEPAVILASIGKWLDSPLVADVLPKSDFAEAVRYIRNHWTALNVYASDGRMPIDNNRVEQLMKQVALGRKAWLFVSNVSSGERRAKMMSLVSSARRHDLDVRAYIEDILEQLLSGVTDYESLLPDAWAKSHPHHIRVYRQEERRDKADRQSAAAARRPPPTRPASQNLTTCRCCALTLRLHLHRAERKSRESCPPRQPVAIAPVQESVIVI